MSLLPVETTRTCFDCAHYIEQGGRCDAFLEDPPVGWLATARDARWSNGPCGHQGRFFLAKPEQVKPKGLLRRLLGL